MKKTLIKIIFFLFSSHTLAEGVANNFYVELVRVDKTGKGYVKFTSALVNSPASCGSPHPYQLAFDVNEPGGQGILSIALAAQASGKKIKAYGTGDCTGIYGSVENWSWGWILSE